MRDIAPMYVVAVLIVDHEEFGSQFFQGADGQFRQQAIATWIDQASFAVILTPTLPKTHQLGSLAVRLGVAIVHGLEFG